MRCVFNRNIIGIGFSIVLVSFAVLDNVNLGLLCLLLELWT